MNDKVKKLIPSIFTEFFYTPQAPGITLVVSTILALIFANFALTSNIYESLLHIDFAFKLGGFSIEKGFTHMVNDGLMAIFFLLVGLEIKREIVEGELSERSKLALPIIGALGGMLVPAIFYIVLNLDNQHNSLNGWAIPTATDIAFAIGVLSLFGNRISASLKIFLTALAIIDDLGAILIIAIFYSSKISLIALFGAVICYILLVICNILNFEKKAPFIILGILLWAFIFKSGIHATIAGVLLATVIPIKKLKQNKHSMLHDMEHGLHGWVSFLILPLFAFTNAGIKFNEISIDEIFHPITLGIMLGLFLG